MCVACDLRWNDAWKLFKTSIDRRCLFKIEVSFSILVLIQQKQEKNGYKLIFEALIFDFIGFFAEPTLILLKASGTNHC